MATTRRDVSGVFDTDLKPRQPRLAAVLDRVSQLSPRGITFVTDKFLPEWTEVGVEMRIPHNNAPNQHVDCRGVVVQCSRRERGNGFEVALLFLDLPKNIQDQLSTMPSAGHPFSISIAR